MILFNLKNDLWLLTAKENALNLFTHVRHNALYFEFFILGTSLISRSWAFYVMCTLAPSVRMKLKIIMHNVSYFMINNDVFCGTNALIAKKWQRTVSVLYGDWRNQVPKFKWLFFIHSWQKILLNFGGKKTGGM